MAFSKLASIKVENPEVSLNTWVSTKCPNVRTASNKMVDFKKVIADFNPDDYLLTHCTIVASVDVEKAPQPVNFGSTKARMEFQNLDGVRDYYITPETSKYVNANGDCWSRSLLKKSYRTFIGAHNYVEHVQDPALSKGRILDAVLREVDDNRSVFVDILVATNRKHTDLVDRIRLGKLNTLSMGSVVAFTICSKCGRVAQDETELCNDIRFFKKNSFISETDGKKRIIAELCGHEEYPESNKFIEGSWVEVPAFSGAVMRNEIELNEIEKEVFAETYAPVAKMKSPDLRAKASRILNAFALVDKVQSAFITEAKDDGGESLDEELDDVLEEPKDEKEDEKTKEEPAPEDKGEEPAPEDKGEEPAPEDKGEDKEDAPPSDSEGLPEELEEIGEDDKEKAPDEEALEEEAKKPYDEVKKEVKEKIKDEIKKEILRDLGISFDEKKPLSRLEDIDTNDNLVKSHLKRNLIVLKKASNIVNEEGLRGLFSHGFSKDDVLKVAYLSRRYSTNKDIFKIVSNLDLKEFPTLRRYAKAVEKKLGRSLAMEERKNLDRLLKDVFFKNGN